MGRTALFPAFFVVSRHSFLIFERNPEGLHAMARVSPAWMVDEFTFSPIRPGQTD